MNMANGPSPEPPNSVIILSGAGRDQNEEGVNLSEPVKNYLRIRSEKPDSRGNILGGIFFIIPALLLIFTNDVFEIIPICCLFYLVSVTLVLINGTHTRNWTKEMNQARKTLETTEKIPYPALPQWPQIAGTVSIVAGFIASDYDGIFLPLGAIVGCGFFAYFSWVEIQKNKAFDQAVNTLVNESNHQSESNIALSSLNDLNSR
jgi:hypothetical protein